MNEYERAAVLSIQMEAASAQHLYGDFTSTHEALGVLIEEFVELLLAIHSNKMEPVAREARQVAAVAGRLFHQASRALKGEVPEFAVRSGVTDLSPKSTKAGEGL